MARFIKDRSAATGKAPGSLIFIGEQKMKEPVIQLMEYDKNGLEEKQLNDISEITPCLKNDKVSWININGIHDVRMIEKLGEILGLRLLFLEDLLNTDQQPIYEDGPTYDGFIFKMLDYDLEESSIESEQITMILGENYVITLQEKKGDLFDPVRGRIRQENRRQRLNHNDYLLYALMDTIIDNYLAIVEAVGREIEDVSVRLFDSNDSGLTKTIFNYKMEMNFLRKQIRPVREIMFQLLRSQDNHFQEDTEQFLRDLNDLVEQASEAIELYSNMVSDHLNIHNTNVGNKMNEVMKVLTIFASIFIPLTFIAGVYGMNFEYIPELQFKYGYFYFWGVIVIAGAALLWYFKRKNWL